jgi:hypothetical protein
VSERLYKFALDSSENSFGWALGENGLEQGLSEHRWNIGPVLTPVLVANNHIS